MGIIGFVVGAVVALFGTYAIADSDPASSDGSHSAPYATPAEEAALPENPPPPPANVVPVEEPNQIGQIPDALVKTCEGDPSGVYAQQTSPNDVTCDIAEAVDQGLVEPGDQLSNEELRDVREDVDETAQP